MLRHGFSKRMLDDHAIDNIVEVLRRAEELKPLPEGLLLKLLNENGLQIYRQQKTSSNSRTKLPTFLKGRGSLVECCKLLAMIKGLYETSNKFGRHVGLLYNRYLIDFLGNIQKHEKVVTVLQVLPAMWSRRETHQMCDGELEQIIKFVVAIMAPLRQITVDSVTNFNKNANEETKEKTLEMIKRRREEARLDMVKNTVAKQGHDIRALENRTDNLEHILLSLVEGSCHGRMCSKTCDQLRKKLFPTPAEPIPALSAVGLPLPPVVVNRDGFIGGTLEVTSREETEKIKIMLEIDFKRPVRVVACDNILHSYRSQLFYATQDALMTKHPDGDGNVRHLWHGTGKMNPEMIAQSEHSLDARYCRAKGFYGRGTYFSERAIYSANEKYVHRDANGNLVLLLVCVILGNHCEYGQKIDKNLSMPPGNFDSVKGGPHQPTKQGEDSNGLESSIIRVVYDNAQVYPQYIVKFKLT